jgi:hypothetical protein
MMDEELVDQLQIIRPNRSLYIFSHKNPIRIFTNRIITYKHFDNVVIALIIISSIILALDNPLKDPESDLSQTLQILDIIMTVLFTIE